MNESIDRRAITIRNQVRGFIGLLRRGPRDVALIAIGLALLIAAGLAPKILPTPGKPPSSVDEIIRWVLLTLAGLGALVLLVAVGRIWKQAVPPPLPASRIMPAAIKGAMAFGPEEGELFVKLGREADLEKLLGWVLDEQIPVVAVMGESGSGKTSLLYSGLTYVLRQRDIPAIYWEARPSDPGADLLHAVRTSWASSSPPPTTLEELASLDDGVRRVVILDQFEQLAPDEHSSVFEMIERVARRSAPHKTKWIIAFRREYDPTWRDFELRLDRFHPPMLSLRQFGVAKAQDIMATLASAANLTLDASVISRWVSATARNGSVSPVQVGIGMLVLSELADEMDQRDLSLRDFLDAGDLTGLLSAYISRAIDRLPEHERRPVLLGLVKLIDPTGDQRLADGRTIKDLASSSGLQRGRIADCLAYLASPQVRILEALPAPPTLAVSYRLAHEQFIPALRRLAGTTLAEAEQSALMFDRRYHQWQRERERRFLLSASELRQIRRHRLQFQSGDDSRNRLRFIRVSKRAHHIRSGLLGVGMLVVAGIGVWIPRYVEGERYRMKLETWGVPEDLYDVAGRLEILSISSSRVTSLDWLKADHLKELVLNTLQLKDCRNLPPNLRTLNLFYTQLTDVALKDLPSSLTTLVLPERITDAALKNLPASLTTLDLNNTEVTDAGLKDLPPALTTLNLAHTNVTFAGLKDLPRSLTTLDLNYTDVTDAGLKDLPPSLTSLDLIVSGVTDARIIDLPSSLRTLSLPERITDSAFKDLPRSLTSLRLYSNRVTDAGLKDLPSALTTLDLVFGQISNAGLKNLPRSLTTLRLENTDVTDEGFGDLPLSLSSFSLQSYQFPKIRVTDTGLKNLPRSLTTLDLSHTEVSDVGFKELPRSLTALDLSFTHITDAGLKNLPRSLTTLNLMDTSVSDAGLKDLPRSLTTLNLTNTGVSDEGLKDLPRSLLALDLSFTHITDAGLKDLPRSLTILNLTNTSVSDAGLNDLPKSLIAINLWGTKVLELRNLPSSVRDLKVSAE